MVAITVATFLIGGMLVMVQSTRGAFGNQNLLAQLQDNERLVMTFMAEVVEPAGYFPNPITNSNTAVFAPNAVFAQAGQVIFGTHTGAPTGDTFSVRFAAALNDNVFNCKGTTNTVVPTYDVFVNTFAVKAVNGNLMLVCTVSSSVLAATDIPLVNGVQYMSVLYGIKRSTGDTGSCADTYLNASQMAPVAFPNDWMNVCSINVSISYTNPLAPAGPPIIINRVIATMTAAGVNS
jgi:type IV pilus assembly protein PilW